MRTVKKQYTIVMPHLESECLKLLEQKLQEAVILTLFLNHYVDSWQYEQYYQKLGAGKEDCYNGAKFERRDNI